MEEFGCFVIILLLALIVGLVWLLITVVAYSWKFLLVVLLILIAFSFAKTILLYIGRIFKYIFTRPLFDKFYKKYNIQPSKMFFMIFIQYCLIMTYPALILEEFAKTLKKPYSDIVGSIANILSMILSIIAILGPMFGIMVFLAVIL